MSDKQRDPIDQPSFWKARLEAAKRVHTDTLHPAVFCCSMAEWQHIQVVHRTILPRVLEPHLGGGRRARVLDAGCGYGALLEILPERVDYLGVDLSPDLVAEARRAYPGQVFAVGDLRRLPALADRSFDCAIARSIDGMVKREMGVVAWRQMEAELLRVADRLVLLGYGEPGEYRIIDALRDPEQGAMCRLEIPCDGGTAHLAYRSGMDGLVELFDMLVPEESRRRGLAARMISSVVRSAHGSVYGFCRDDNHAVMGVYRKLGFDIVQLGRLYRNDCAFVAIKRFDSTEYPRLAPVEPEAPTAEGS